MRRKWIIIPIETIVREFDSKLLLSCFAVERGYGVIIGYRKLIQKKVLSLLPKNGIYLDKSAGVRHGVPFVKPKEYGHKLVSIDAEGLVYNNDEEYFRKRLSVNAIKESDLIFTWGRAQRDFISSKIPEESNKIVNTGEPRVDLWRREFRGIYLKEAHKIQKKYGPYVLIASNFVANHAKGNSFPLKQAIHFGMVKTDFEIANFNERHNHKLRILKDFLNVLPRLSQDFPNLNFIIRPHPSESHVVWKDASKNLKNVKVIFEGSISPWVLGAQLVLHNDCTTGIEAVISGVQSISYRPYKSDEYDSFLPIESSFEVFNVDELISSISKIINGEKLVLKAPKDLINRISSIKGSLASERILDEIDKFQIKETTLFSKSISKKSLAESPKVVIINALTLLPIFLIPKKFTKLYNYKLSKRASKQKFGWLTKAMIKKRLKSITVEDKRFKDIKFKKLKKNLFYIFK